MVVDTSAILSIAFGEATAMWVFEQIAGADPVLMSTVNLAEVLIRFHDRKPDLVQELKAELLASGIQFIAPDIAQATLVARARFIYPLNFGDCFAYALAKVENQSILTLDADFRSVDVAVILPPQS